MDGNLPTLVRIMSFLFDEALFARTGSRRGKGSLSLKLRLVTGAVVAAGHGQRTARHRSDAGGEDHEDRRNLERDLVAAMWC